MPWRMSLYKTPTVATVMEVEPELEDAADRRETTLPSQQGATREEEGRYTEMQRGLKSRHLQLLALGGCIGTGLFVGTGATLSVAGPAPLFLSFIVISAVVWVVVQCLAEMTTHLPVEGASVPYYVNRYVCPSLAFATGWNYWYTYAMAVATEISAASVVIEYWDNPVPSPVWITFILLTIVLLNVISVSYYGESEFWVCSLKILALSALLILGVILFFGGGPNHDRLGFRYWTLEPPDSGPFKSYPKPHLGNLGKFLAFWAALIRSGFAFVMGPELITLAAGECQSPRKNIPKASRKFIFRLVVFYVFGSLIISILVSSNDTDLLSAVSHSTKTAAASPFVLGIKRAGLCGLDHAVNAIILISAWSAANGFLYAGSRSLYSLSLNGQAPRFLQKCNGNGVPWVALLCTAGLACLSYMSVKEGSRVVFGWFLSLATVSGFLAWVVVLGTHLRFRHILTYHQISPKSLPYTNRLGCHPIIVTFTLLIFVLLTLTNGFAVFFPGEFSVNSFLAAYITLPLFAAFYAGHWVWRLMCGGNWKGKRELWMIRPVVEVDMSMRDIEEEEEREGKGGWWRRVWGWII